MGDRFETTRWTLVLAARDAEDTQARQALAGLCEAYWRPIYAFIRRMGHDASEAADLTQAYFADLLEKGYLAKADPAQGKFRSFLLASVKHVLSHERARKRTLKRGAGRSPVSLDRNTAESQYGIEPVERLTPETLFERQWALTVLDRVTDRVRDDFVADGKQRHFELLKDYIGRREATMPYREVGEELGMSEAAVKMAVRRLRKHFARSLRAEIAETVASPDQIDDEIRHLRSVLRSS